MAGTKKAATKKAAKKTATTKKDATTKKTKVKKPGNSDPAHAGRSRQRPPRSVDGGEHRVFHRSEVSEDPQNPRAIDSYSAKKLGDSLKSTGGVLGGIVVNTRTMQFVGGHQRIAQFDKQYPDGNYTFTACAIDVDLDEQRRINVLLNNPELAGLYDIDRLDELIRDGLDYAAAGMSPTFLEEEYLAAGIDVPDFLLPSGTPDDTDAETAAASIGDILDESDAARVGEVGPDGQQGEPGDDSGGSDDPDSDGPTYDKDWFDKKREEFSARAAFDQQSLFHATFVFPSNDHASEFLAGMDFNPNADHHDGMKLAHLLGFEFVLSGGGHGTEGDGGLDEESTDDPLDVPIDEK